MEVEKSLMAKPHGKTEVVKQRLVDSGLDLITFPSAFRVSVAPIGKLSGLDVITLIRP